MSARIGLDVRLTPQMSAGMQRYAVELADRLPRVAPEFSYVRFSRGGNFGWSEQVVLPRDVARAKVDLVHFLAHYTPVVVPARSIVTVHDLIHLRFPQYFKARVGPYYRTVVRLACARASRVITDDERTVNDLERFLGVNPKKVRVIALGASCHPEPLDFARDELRYEAPESKDRTCHPERRCEAPESKDGRDRAYFLNVGNHRTHKNLQTLLDAWSALPQRYDVDLYFTGRDDFDGALQRASTRRRTARALGDLSEQELVRYYAGARALVHPALREGFGLPMLEAMAEGTAVVASEEAAPRVLADATLRFPAGDASAITACLTSILENEGLRARLVNEGRMLAERLTWDRCAAATAAVYHEVLG
jgi:glycosyltransferase involved in cell wall biosynthesis